MSETKPPSGAVPTNHRPAFLITIDAEGDNVWSRQKNLTTANSNFVPRFQALCESYQLRPTYLTNFEMATCHRFQEFGRDILKRGTGEIGMHLHPWNSPPLIPLTSDDARSHPYLTEYPEAVMRDKVAFLTDLLEETFGVKMTAHRAGRWGFNSTYARLLIERDYLADCSVTPHVSWAKSVGDPAQKGGADYSKFLELPYFIDPENIDRPGNSSLLEIPVTVMDVRPRLVRSIARLFPPKSLPRRALNHFFPPICRLYSPLPPVKLLLRAMERAAAAERPCVQLALHSSELMPGGSPFFPEAEDIDVLYDYLHLLFGAASKMFRGVTVTEFWREFWERKPAHGINQLTT